MQLTRQRTLTPAASAPELLPEVRPPPKSSLPRPMTPALEPPRPKSAVDAPLPLFRPRSGARAMLPELPRGKAKQRVQSNVYSAAGCLFFEGEEGSLCKAWAEDESTTPMPWVSRPAEAASSSSDNSAEADFLEEPLAAQRLAEAHVDKLTEVEASLTATLEELRKEMAKLAREAKGISHRNKRPAPSASQLDVADSSMAGHDLMSQWLSPEEMAKEKREAAKARRKHVSTRSDEPPPRPKPPDTAEQRAVEEALRTLRARERDAVRTLEAVHEDKLHWEVHASKYRVAQLQEELRVAQLQAQQQRRA